MNEKHIEDIITALYDMVQDARAVPLAADKCILEREKALDMLDQIIAQLPAELKQSRINKRVRNAVFGCNLKNNRMISVCFQGKSFSIMIIQICTLTSNAEEAEVEWFYEDLQDVLELTPKKDVLFIIGDWNAKV